MDREEAVFWTLRATSLGTLLVAATRRGVCHVRFGGDAGELAAALQAELPFASLRRAERAAGDGAATAGAPAGALATWADVLAACAEGDAPAREVPLDVAGSRFQRRVWDALRRIPRGAVCSYAGLAAALGRPGAARAVGRACASNPVPLAVPCHRVVRADGALGGYRYGPWRKAALLRREAGAGAAAPASPGAGPSPSAGAGPLRPPRAPAPGAAPGPR